MTEVLSHRFAQAGPREVGLPQAHLACSYPLVTPVPSTLMIAEALLVQLDSIEL